MAGNQKTKQSDTNSFTVDSDVTGVGMPSVTRLLNRKSLNLSNSSETKATQTAMKKKATPPPFVGQQPPSFSIPKKEVSSPSSAPAQYDKTSVAEISISTEEPKFELETHSKPDSEVQPTEQIQSTATVQTLIKKTGRQRNQAAPQLVQWDLATLKTGKDPLGSALAALFDKEARSALFLSTQAPPPNCPVPHFLSSAAVMPRERATLWAGSKWDPTIVPDLWNDFVKRGYVELSPPGTQTNVKSNRNIVRSAFGIRQSEWILLIRVGSAQICRGVVVVVSEKSLFHEVEALLPLFSTVNP